MSKEIRIVIGQPAFQALVRGGEVTVKLGDGEGGIVKMILQDIGFSVMRNAINLAEGGEKTYVGETVRPDGERAV
jgi:hypothetical protein